MEYNELLEALDAETERAVRAIRGSTDDDLSLPTRCPPWDVQVLVGHMIRDVDRVSTYVAAPPPGPASRDAVTYFRSYDPATQGPVNTANSTEVANRYRTPAEFSAALELALDGCLAAARSEDPARVLETRLTSIRLDEFIKTRILEIGVHGLDLAAALGLKPWLTPAAASVVQSILVALLGADPKADLGWSDLTFIEAATGRRPLTEAERAVLGIRAGSFPLLG
jgi:uncharacterized protein (TIGR03083 family)